MAAGGIGILLLACCCLLAVCWRRRHIPSPLYGERYIPALGQKSTYSTEKKKHDVGTKTHIIWEHDRLKLDTAFPNQESYDSQQEEEPFDQIDIEEAKAAVDVSCDVIYDLDAYVGHSGERPKASAMQPSAASATSRSSDWSTSDHSRRHFRLLIGRDMKNSRSVGDEYFGYPAYEHGCKVEYFSCSNQCWLLGVVSLDAICNGKGNDLVSIVYNVSLGRTSQERYDVNIHLLRRPPQRDELVEVRTHDEGPWLLGRITGVKWTVRGRIYSVQLDTPDKHKGREVIFPGLNLRRRFPVDSTVLVYGGHCVGWRKGVMQSGTLKPITGNTQGSDLPPVEKLFRRHKLRAPEHLDVAPDQRVFSVLVEDDVEEVPAHLLDFVQDAADWV